jgi:hypothetical protein
MLQALKEALNKNPMYDKEDVGEIAEVDINNMGRNELAKLHQPKRAFQNLVLATFLEKKQKHPSPVGALGSAMDASALAASYKVLHYTSRYHNITQTK